MKKTLKYTSASLLFLAALTSLWFLLNNLGPLTPGLYSFAFLCLAATGLAITLLGKPARSRLKHFVVRTISLKYFPIAALSTLVLLGIAIRIYFYFQFTYTPVSDPITFFQAGQKIADGHGLTGDAYAAFFPYLAAYNGILGFAMSLISDPWLATIILNTIFDIAAAFVVYYVVKLLAKPESKLPIVAFAFWILSPFNILFSLISLPVIIVNFFIITSVLLVILFINSLKKGRAITSLLLALIVGICLSLGNVFRPVFVIALVALFVSFIYIILRAKNRRKLTYILAAAYALITVIFLASQQLHVAIVASSTGLNPSSSSSGWSIFVGSNWESEGRWNRQDEIKLTEICANTITNDDCHEELRKAGVERYKNYGALDTINLFIRKLYIFSSNQSNVYNANLSIDNYADSKTQKLFEVYLIVFMISLFYLCFKFFYEAAKSTLLNKPAPSAIIFITLLLLGFFLSIVFVETSERYAQIMYPLFIVTAALGIRAGYRTEGRI